MTPGPASRSWHLTTPRLGFDVWAEADIAHARTLWGDPRVTRLIDARDRLSDDDVRERLGLEIASQERHGFQYWPVFLRQSGEFVGCCGIKPYHGVEGGRMLGYYLVPGFWGRGLASEAAAAAVGHAFGALDLPRLYAGHHPDNHASGAVLRKLGFVHFGEELFAGTGAMHPLYLLERAQ